MNKMNRYKQFDVWCDKQCIRLWPRTKSAIEWGNKPTFTGLRRGENIVAIAILLLLAALTIWRALV